jgi:hypothetical protein
VVLVQIIPKQIPSIVAKWEMNYSSVKRNMPKMSSECWLQSHQMLNLCRPLFTGCVTLLEFKMELVMNPVSMLDGDLCVIKCMFENILLRGF